MGRKKRIGSPANRHMVADLEALVRRLRLENATLKGELRALKDELPGTEATVQIKILIPGGGTKAEAKRFREIWFKCYPEMRWYLRKWVSIKSVEGVW